MGISFLDVTKYRQLRDELERSNHDLEHAYEELQSLNEELETTNEELQSTNEELETTNEELQSTNDELQLINDVLRLRGEERITSPGEEEKPFSRADHEADRCQLLYPRIQRP